MNVALTIAGSDSGGGAGIQADLKTFHQFKVFGTSVITAVTAQNTKGVRGWKAVEPELIRSQIIAVASDLPPAATKTGMLPDAATVETVAAAIRDNDFRNVIVDPVMVATSGDALVLPDAIAAIIAALIPLASLVTPNLDEAGLLIGSDVTDLREMRAAAEFLVRVMGARAALVKGGHLAGADVTDVLYDGEFTVISHPRIDTRSTHGTGCTLSAAITAGLAEGMDLRDAVRRSVGYVQRAIIAAPGLGSGHGPLNHFVSSTEPTNSRTSD